MAADDTMGAFVAGQLIPGRKDNRRIIPKCKLSGIISSFLLLQYPRIRQKTCDFISSPIMRSPQFSFGKKTYDSFQCVGRIGRPLLSVFIIFLFQNSDVFFGVYSSR